VSYLNFNLSRSSHNFKTITDSDGVVVGLKVQRGHQTIHYHRTSRGIIDFVHPKRGEWRTFFPSEKNLLNTLQNKIVLDLGCGDGAFVRELHAKSVLIYGLDIYFNETQRKTPCFLEGDAFAIPVKAECFQVVTSSYSVFHYEPLENLGLLFREVHRVLTTGGHLYLTQIEDQKRLLQLRHLSEKLKMQAEIDAMTGGLHFIKN
jgi:ubiquinone/menaquinone biosynthesis C-methylase UbiE